LIDVEMVEPHSVKKIKGEDFGNMFHNLFDGLASLYDGEPMQKHQQHDQQSHGNWAADSSSSTSDSMPYEWKPRNIMPEKVGLDDERYKTNLEIFKNVAEASVAIRIYASDFEDILQDGKFKSLKEITEKKPYRAGNYEEARNILEHGGWGIPKDKEPIYGYLDTNYDGHISKVDGYGDIKVTLKDSVKNRTTFVAGDSLDLQENPVLISDAKNKNLSKSKIFSANRALSGPKSVSYYEAQIHGGVSLKDIKSVTRTSQYTVNGVPFYMPFNTEMSRILRENNIEVLVEEGTKVSRVND